MNSTFEITNYVLDLLSRYLENGVGLHLANDRLELQALESSPSQPLETLTPELQMHLQSMLQEEIGRPLQGGTLLPLSWIQRRHYFVTRHEGAEVSSTVPHALRFNGKLDRAALRDALLHLQRVHPMLRAPCMKCTECYFNGSRQRLNWQLNSRTCRTRRSVPEKHNWQRFHLMSCADLFNSTAAS